MFLNLEQRLEILDGINIQTVPVLHQGAAGREQLLEMIGPSRFDSRFENSLTGTFDYLMEGIYLRAESAGCVTGRAKMVRSEFTEQIKQSTHWQHREMIPNLLAEGVDLWS